MTILRNLLLAFPVVGCCSSVGFAEIIYSQTTPEEPGASFTSLDLPGVQKIADNFQFISAEPVTIRSLRFIGAVTNLVDTPEDDFRVVFLNDSGGSPGSLTPGGDFSVGAAVQKSFTGGELLSGRPPIEYLLDLGDGMTLESETEYWISVTNNLGQDYGWFWARGVGVLDQRLASTFGDVTTGPWTVGTTSSGMWFELNTNNVPEPASLVLLCSGFACLIWLRHLC